jgi:hypothetical protein
MMRAIDSSRTQSAALVTRTLTPCPERAVIHPDAILRRVPGERGEARGERR